MSLYDYAGGDPINGLDPTGRIATSAAPQIKTNLYALASGAGNAFQSTKDGFSEFTYTLLTDPAKVARGVQSFGDSLGSAAYTTLDYYSNISGSDYVSDLETGLGLVGENFNTQEKAFHSTGAILANGLMTAIPGQVVRPARVVAPVGAAPTAAGRTIFQSGAGRGVEMAGDLLDTAVAHGTRRGTYSVEVLKPFFAEARVMKEAGEYAAYNLSNKTASFLPQPRRIEVLEEVLHSTQQRLGIIDELGFNGADIHVREFMIRHRKMLGIGEEDVNILKEMLENAKKGN